jgi:hypothetical protein
MCIQVTELTEEVTTTSYNTFSDIEGDYDDGYNEGDDDDDERSQSAIGMFMSNAKLLRGHHVPLPEFGSDTFDGKYENARTYVISGAYQKFNFWVGRKGKLKYTSLPYLNTTNHKLP